MPRPQRPRKIRFNPDITYFKPQGVPLRQLEEIELFEDELEALKLYYQDGLNQIDCAQKMEISQPTFARILARANKKIASAVINGKAIKITKTS